MELANKYGPTFREIASDMGYANDRAAWLKELQRKALVNSQY